MDFNWTNNQLELKESIVHFAKTELSQDFIDRDKKGEFSRQDWKKIAQHGVIGYPFPKEYGGNEGNILDTMLIMEGLGYGFRDAALIFGINAQMWSVQMPIVSHGTAFQKEKYLTPMIKGEMIGGHCMSEPLSGSDAYSLKATAVKNDDFYILNGSKTYITNGPVSDVYLVFANIAPQKGMWGVTAFLVEKDTEGLFISPVIEKMGLKTIPMGALELRDCKVPIENRLGPEGSGAQLFHGSMEWERSCILASSLGAMDYQLEKSIEYVKGRKQFGRSISDFQSVSNRVVDMKVRIETARLMLYKVAWLKSIGKSAVMEAAIAKLYLSECFVQSSIDAVRVHGANGYLTDFGVEHELRDSIGGLIYSGTSDIQRNIIARMLGL
ncbi:MAG: acyl-CoA dehydrogenase family protein [Anaerolineaceae bacterium]